MSKSLPIAKLGRMAIDIDRLTEAELVDLNHRVVERLRFLHQARAHQEMLRFSIGQRVAFDHAGGRVVRGVITRYNKKSVSLVTETGERWNVAPIFLRADGPAAEKGYVVDEATPLLSDDRGGGGRNRS